MADMNRIHGFAVKWIDKFRDQKINYIELVDHYMAYDGVEIIEPANRSWFILALSRLALLTGENPFIFEGTPKKMRIISNNICYGPCPEQGDEMEQHLTINMDGRVWFSAYAFGNRSGKYIRARGNNFSIGESSATELLNKTASYFSEEYDELSATDIGDWVLELTNTDGKTYKFRGSLCADFEEDGVGLSDLIRDTLGMTELYIFDGNSKPDVINRIALDYHGLTKIKPTAAVSIQFFKRVQNKIHYAVSGETAAEVIWRIARLHTECRKPSHREKRWGAGAQRTPLAKQEAYNYEDCDGMSLRVRLKSPK